MKEVEEKEAEKKVVEDPKGDSTPSKFKAALGRLGELIAKYVGIGCTKFINWLDEAGAKKDELSDDLLIAMEGEEEPTPRRLLEAEREKERAKLKAIKKAKYKSMIYLKPPTSSMFLSEFFVLIPSSFTLSSSFAPPMSNLIISLALDKTYSPRA